MSILGKIIADKRIRVDLAKSSIPVSELEKGPLFRAERPSFREALRKPGPSVIAEFKRKSPSRGFINEGARPEIVIPGYEKAGAAAVSVLTDGYFDGSLDDLSTAFRSCSLPLLRKDFIIDEYQVVEARSAGASAILLIAAALEKRDLEKLAGMAFSLGLDVLFEIHNEVELEKCPQTISIVGVNNRNLETFEVNTGISVKLAPLIPDGCLRVSESGIGEPQKIFELADAGFDAFLIGETFMRSSDPGGMAFNFIHDIQNKKIPDR